MYNYQSTQGDFSPINNGNGNKVKGKKKVTISVMQEWAIGIGGFVTGVLASLVANWIWDIF
ncbi:MAG: hypothetical protein IKP45_13930 [Bacteroidales bacterium]|nr:hypothetical protein [Bacteroidales bacterium]